MDPVRFQVVHNRANLARALGRELMEDWLDDVTEDCLGDANLTIPYETGAMAGSGFAEVDGMEGQVAYDTPYAVAQHEDPTIHHDEGRRDHWLSQTVEENAGRYQAHLGILAQRRFRD